MKSLWLKTLLALAFIAPAWADFSDGSATPPSAALGLSQQMLCEVVAVGSGNIALLAGLIVALYGLWYMVRHGSLKTGFILIISGALLTALPSLIISTMDGVAAWLYNAKISQYGNIDEVKSITGQSGNCSAISVDWSGYTNMPGWWSSINDPFNTGAGNPQNSVGGGGDMALGGPIDPNAVTGSGGCANLVDGGSPGSPFGPRQSVQTLNGRMSSSNHKGTDVRCGGHTGAQIHAASSGTITTAWVNGYGNRAVITSGSGVKTTYNHMTGYGPTVKNGQSIGAGDVVGYCGQTGNATGPHLHFEMIKNGVFVDPVANGCGG